MKRKFFAITLIAALCFELIVPGQVMANVEADNSISVESVDEQPDSAEPAMPDVAYEGANKTLTSTQIKNYFESKVGSTVPQASCLAFIADGFAALGATRSSACCAYDYGTSRIVSTSMNNIPIGADVFLNWNSNYGGTWYYCPTTRNYCHHIGVYVGDGYIVHTSNGKVVKTSLTQMLNYWNVDFRGWGYHGNVTISNTPASNVSIALHDVSNITDTGAKISCRVEPAYNATEAGFYFGTTKSSMTKIKEPMSYNTSFVEVWYDLGTGKWTQALSPGVQYFYQMYVICNGVEYKTAVDSFVTTNSLVRINLDTTDITLNTGDSYTFEVKYTPHNTSEDKTVSWSSSNKSVATVSSSGKVTAVGAGTATITATVGSCKATCQVTVVSNTPNIPNDTPGQSNTVEGFVDRMYTVALGRTADSAGKSNWVNVLKAGTHDGAAIAKEFILGREFAMRNLSNDAYMDVLYKTFFNRSADASGKKNWLDHLSAGYSREYILSQFVNSEEFTNLCQTFGVERGVMLANGASVNVGIPKFVNRLYSTVMGRAADCQGYNNWTMVLATKQQTAEQVAKSFFTCSEYLNKNTNNTTFVNDLYKTFLNRNSDSAGLSNWKNQLSYGVSRSTVISEFARSAEFKAIAAKYGLE